jgi:hypothetical protein
MDGEVLLLLVEFDDQPFQPCVDGPVHRSRVVARRVVPVVGEFKAGAVVAGGPVRAVFAFEEPPAKKGKLLQFREENGIKKRWLSLGVQSA